MKKTIKFLVSSVLCLSAVSCLENGDLSGYMDMKTAEIKLDVTAIENIAAQDPADASIIVDCENAWVAKASESWMTVSPDYGGGGKTIVTISFKSNFRNDQTDMAARSGELTFSSHGKVVTIPVRQNGFVAEKVEVTNLGGIPDSDEFKAFAEAATGGLPLTRWTNEESGYVELLADIDLGGQAWTPICPASSTSGGTIDGVAFTEKFDGKGHKVSGLSINVNADNAETNHGYALFGVVDAGEVKNLEVVVNDVYVETNTMTAAVGAVVGMAVNGALVENCKSTPANDNSRCALKITGGTGTVNYCGGTVGMMYASTIKDCVNGVPVRVFNEINTGNGGTGVHAGGVLGWCTGSMTITGCTNNAQVGGIFATDRWGSAGRMGGIVATCNAFVQITNCTNNGNLYNTHPCTSDKSTRTAGIVAYLNTANSTVEGCVNNGDVCFVLPDDGVTYAGYCSGMVGQPNGVINITACENYGAILSDRYLSTGNYLSTADEPAYPEVAVVMGRPNSKASVVTNCKIGGKVGPYSDASKVVTLDASNFATFMYGDTYARRKAVATNELCTGNVFAKK